MKVVIQRVRQAQVVVGQKVVGQIDQGIVILVSFAPSDDTQSIVQFVQKLLKLAIFEYQGKIAKNIKENNGEILVVPQFTLHANLKKGNKPSFSRAAAPKHAKQLFDHLIKILEEKKLKVQQGCFGAHMLVSLDNDGPLTYIINIGEKECL